MLSSLHIQNIAVIHKASVNLAQGLNVFTGETGAGKTILISAIDAVLGERTSKDIIRTGEDRAQVTALFEDISPRAKAALKSLGYSDEEGSVLITRELHASGKGSCKINGMPATASMLKAVSPLLIHIHGQRDSAQLLAPERHMEMIDLFGAHDGVLDTYRDAYDGLCAVRGELEALQMDDAQKAQRIDMLTYQIQEIEAADLGDPDEEEVLQAQKRLIKNSEKVLGALAEAYAALRGSEETAGIDSLMDGLTGGVAAAAEYMAGLAPMAARLAEIGYELSDFAQEIHASLDEFEFDLGELDRIESRLDTIYKLKRKYGADIPEILAHLERAQTELESITTSEVRARQLEQVMEEKNATAQALSQALSQARAEAAAAFVAQVEAELAFLDMPSVRLSLRHTRKELSPNGVDEMEFYIVTNVGEEPKPLCKIASGGEISRIMLAMKNVLAERDDVATLIFDEVDSGVSGRAAQKIGHKLAQVSRARQVVCVTHLAQVAAFADRHLLIHKEVDGGRTFTRIATLDEDAAVKELARISSGELLTEAALASAKELREHSRAALK